MYKSKRVNNRQRERERERQRERKQRGGEIVQQRERRMYKREFQFVTIKYIAENRAMFLPFQQKVLLKKCVFVKSWFIF